MPDQTFIDGVSSAQPTPVPAEPAKKPDVKATPMLKAGLLATLAIPYVFYIFWCVFLLSAFPAQGASQNIISIGVLSTAIAAILFLAIGGFGFFRVSSSAAQPNAKLKALIKLGAFVFPGLLFSVVTPFMISGEPAFAIDIVSPTSTDRLVAPLSMSFSVQSAVTALAQYGFKPIQYNWDINGDKKTDQQTLNPELTAKFDKEGVYGISVTMKSADGTVKVASKRFIISQSVFSVTPSPTIVDRPAVFSLAHLYPKPEDVMSVAWDFDGDGKFDEENGGIQASHTYLATESYTVTSVVQLANKTQKSYQRSVDVVEPPVLPFPVSLKTQPQNLIGIKPFSAMFSVETEEPLYGVQWDFGDGEKTDGKEKIATHTFGKNGTFPVTAKVRSQSGVVAEVGTVVRVVDRLDLNDLRFEPPIVNSNTISGELPLTLDLTPVTATPFVRFSWEAPDATEVGSTDNRLQAIYRRAGTYTVTLVAQDMENHVLRLPITIEVKKAAPLLTFSMSPTFNNAAPIAPVDMTFDASASTVEDIDGFIWNFGDGSPEKNCRCAIVSHLYQLPKTYVVSVRAVTKNGTVQSDPQNLFIGEPSLQARILASRLEGPPYMSVEFSGSGSTGNIVEYLWDFDDNTSNDGAAVDHIFQKSGVYRVSLTVTDKAGNTATSTVTITVK